jgi:hypothetical protein
MEFAGFADCSPPFTDVVRLDFRSRRRETEG